MPTSPSSFARIGKTLDRPFLSVRNSRPSCRTGLEGGPEADRATRSFHTPAAEAPEVAQALRAVAGVVEAGARRHGVAFPRMHARAGADPDEPGIHSFPGGIDVHLAPSRTLADQHPVRRVLATGVAVEAVLDGHLLDADR